MFDSNMITMALVGLVIFGVVPNIILLFLNYIKKNYLTSKEKLKQNQLDPDYLPINKRFSRDVSFAMGLPNQKMKMLIAFAVGIILVFLMAFIDNWMGLILIASLWQLFIVWPLSNILGKKKRLEREAVLNRMLDIKLKMLGSTSKVKSRPQLDEEIKVLAWDETMIYPTKVRFSVPATFDSLYRDTFLTKFNDAFGYGKTWVPDVEDKDHPGWDMKNGFLTLITMTPLPEIANFHERYILNERVAWSFFPLGMGSQGGVEVIDPHTNQPVHLLGFDVFGAQQKLGKKKGFYVGPEVIQSPQTLIAGVTGSGKSVLQRAVVAGCVLRPEKWVMLAIDLKKVELSPLRKYGVSVATDVISATKFLRFAANVMMSRYTEMEKLGINNFENMPTPGQAIMVMIDESAELFGEAPGKSEEAKDLNELKGECAAIVQSITQLGRAAGVYMIIASQRSNVDSIGGGTTRSNLSNRIGCGALPQASSQMAFESSMGARTPAAPRGRFLLKIHSKYAGVGQAFWINDEPYWFDEYFEKYPERNPEVVHARLKATQYEEDNKNAPIQAVSEDEALADWDDDMAAIKAAKKSGK